MIRPVQYLKESIDINRYDIVPFLKIVRRDYIFKNGLFFMEGVFYEDQEYTYKMLLNTKGRLLRVPFSFYYYRERPDSTTHTYELKKGTDFIKVIRRMIREDEQFKTKKHDRRYDAYADSIVAMAIYHLSAIYVHMSSKDQYLVRKAVTPEISHFARQTLKLSWRMKIQNRMFLYLPHLLQFILTKK